MANLQLFTAIGVPVLVMIVGFVLQNKAIQGEISGLRIEMLARFQAADSRLDRIDRRIDEIERRVGVIEADLRQFYSITGNHEGRIGALEKR